VGLIVGEDARAVQVQHALDRLPDGALVAGSDGGILAVNLEACRLLESTVRAGDPLANAVCLQDLDGNDWFTCVRPYDGLRLRTRLVESSWWTPSGREVLVTARLARDRPGGDVTGVALSLRTARARERADRSRSELVATVAHELRSPLTGVKGFTSTLISKWDRLTDSQKLLMLSTVDADADRLTRLITELLDVARIDTGRLSVRKEPVRLAPVLASLLEPMEPPNGRTLTFLTEGDPTIWVDRDRLAQVVANLVENAFAHGDGAVTVVLRSRADDGAELVVDDEGKGIADDIRPRIFTKFWRHGRAGGSGLGLFIVSGLVAAHGGSVSVERSVSGGARMRVTLPQGEPDGLT
jgi:signal transduction histidine kinase